MKIRTALEILVVSLAFTALNAAARTEKPKAGPKIGEDADGAVYLCVSSNGRRELVNTYSPGCKRLDVPGPLKPTEAEARAARSFARLRLRDPDSANFKDLIKSRDGKYVCGYLNAKNRMGGYEGFQGFVVNLTTKEFRINEEAGAELFDECE